MIGNYIKAAVAAVSRSTATLMKTGQTTSYATGDDGDIEAGRNIDFFTLAENNPFGNTNRFTDELGGNTYTKNIVIDWSTFNGSTVLGYRRTITLANWANAVSGALAVSIAPFTTGWRLPNSREVVNIMNNQLVFQFNYPPFNFSNDIWTSNTIATTANALLTQFGGQLMSDSKSNNRAYIPCRTFTVTGTTLS